MNENIKMSKGLVSITLQYNSLLTRFARRLLTEPHYAEDVLIKIFEELYDKNKLYCGPDLRNDLKNAIIDRCRGYKFIEFENKTEKGKLDLGESSHHWAYTQHYIELF
jgi:DNA-directed RNA polymerase specialized sigma24 family protein